MLMTIIIMILTIGPHFAIRVRFALYEPTGTETAKKLRIRAISNSKFSHTRTIFAQRGIETERRGGEGRPS